MDRLKRQITLTEVLKSPQREMWEKEHVICYGIQDDIGVESIIKVDKITFDSIKSIGDDMKKMSLRARFNTQRNAKTFLVWIHKNSYHLIEKLLEKQDFKRAQKVLNEHGMKC